MLIIVYVPKPIVDEPIHHSVVPEPVSRTCIWEVVWDVGHAFHATCNDNVSVAAGDAERCEHGGFHAGRAHLDSHGHTDTQRETDRQTNK